MEEGMEVSWPITPGLGQHWVSKLWKRALSFYSQELQGYMASLGRPCVVAGYQPPCLVPRVLPCHGETSQGKGDAASMARHPRT